MTSFSVVIPVYNAEANLNALYERITNDLQESSHEFEVVLVEDHSEDNSWEIIKRLSEMNARVRGIRLSRNFGQHNALLCGIRAAKFGTIVTMDDDLQNPPSEIHRLLEKLNEGYDVVYGTPEKQQHGFLRDMASSMTKIALQSGMGVNTARNVSAFRAFRTWLRKGFQDYQGPFVSIDVLLTWSTSNFTSIVVRHDERVAGKSNYTLGKLINHAINLMTGFSTLPLQIASIMGFVFTLFGFGVLAWVLGRYFIVGGSIPGFPFLASIIAIFSGAQLFALGIFGEYLARIHFRTMNRPSFVISETSEKTGD
jgi:glycosyltransferase involved in cell wall biosynthesis